MAGATFQSIADELGFSNRSSAADAVTRALQATTPKELIEEVRRLENRRLDDIWAPMYEKALEGDGGAVDPCLKIMARKADPNGLDTPGRVQQVVITEDDLDRAIARLEFDVAAWNAHVPQSGHEDPEVA